MNKVFSIAGITIRSALRSRVVITLFFLLLLMIIGLPLTVQGDGTLSGHVQLLLNYTLGSASLLLAIVSVWIGCASVSTEIQERQIQLIVTKPVHALEIWLGKWIGILALNAILLAFAGLVAFGLLLWTTRPAVLTDEEQRSLKEEILVARSTLSAEPVDVTKQARALFEQRRAAGALPSGIPVEQAYELLRETLLVQAYSVQGGTSRQWTFDLPRTPNSTHPFFLRFRFSASSGLRVPVKCVWSIGTKEDPYRFQKEEVYSAGGHYSLRIPASVAQGSRSLVVTYGHIDPNPVTVLFPHKDGVQLLLYEGPFLSNYFRALLMLFFQLAFLAAIGLAAGSCFSLPVAAFVSCWFVLLINMGHYMQAMAQKTTFFAQHGQALPEPVFWDHIFHAVYRTLSWLVTPLQATDTLNLLTAGELISGHMLAGSFVIRVVLYSGLMALLSAAVLRRREMALAA